MRTIEDLEEWNGKSLVYNDKAQVKKVLRELEAIGIRWRSGRLATEMMPPRDKGSIAVGTKYSRRISISHSVSANGYCIEKFYEWVTAPQVKDKDNDLIV